MIFRNSSSFALPSNISKQFSLNQASIQESVLESVEDEEEFENVLKTPQRPLYVDSSSDSTRKEQNTETT